jgi:hypothetical protein
VASKPSTIGVAAIVPSIRANRVVEYMDAMSPAPNAWAASVSSAEQNPTCTEKGEAPAAACTSSRLHGQRAILLAPGNRTSDCTRCSRSMQLQAPHAPDAQPSPVNCRNQSAPAAERRRTSRAGVGNVASLSVSSDSTESVHMPADFSPNANYCVQFARTWSVTVINIWLHDVTIAGSAKERICRNSFRMTTAVSCSCASTVSLPVIISLNCPNTARHLRSGALWPSNSTSNWNSVRGQVLLRA